MALPLTATTTAMVGRTATAVVAATATAVVAATATTTAFSWRGREASRKRWPWGERRVAVAAAVCRFVDDGRSFCA